MYEVLVDGYGTLYVMYWIDNGSDDPVCEWIIPGTINPLDD